MPVTVVELHLRIVPAPGEPAHAYQYPWIQEIQDELAGWDGDIEEYDDGEESRDHFAGGESKEPSYVFFLTGADEDELLSAAARLAGMHPRPAGAFALVTDDVAEEIGVGRRVELSVPAPRGSRGSDRKVILELYFEITVPEDPRSAPEHFQWLHDIQVTAAGEGGVKQFGSGHFGEDEFEDRTVPVAVLTFRGADEAEMLDAAMRLVATPGAPTAAWAMIHAASARDRSSGRRVDLGPTR